MTRPAEQETRCWVNAVVEITVPLPCPVDAPEYEKQRALGIVFGEIELPDEASASARHEDVYEDERGVAVPIPKPEDRERLSITLSRDEMWTVYDQIATVAIRLERNEDESMTELGSGTWRKLADKIKAVLDA